MPNHTHFVVIMSAWLLGILLCSCMPNQHIQDTPNKSVAPPEPKHEFRWRPLTSQTGDNRVYCDMGSVVTSLYGWGYVEKMFLPEYDAWVVSLVECRQVKHLRFRCAPRVFACKASGCVETKPEQCTEIPNNSYGYAWCNEASQLCR